MQMWLRSKETSVALPEMSMWPMLGGVSGMGLTVGFVFLWWGSPTMVLVLVGMSLVLSTMWGWWRDLKKEGLRGEHTQTGLNNLRGGVILFITSEVCFFGAFFWSYFHGGWSPGEIMGGAWPPFSFSEVIVDPYGVPLLKTVMLMSSGVTVTSAHYSILQQENSKGIISRGATMMLASAMLGVGFLTLQISEYSEGTFSYDSGYYGSVFYTLTGFHGAHVFIGVVMLLVGAFRISGLHVSSYEHVGVEGGMWYWHFVDVVWLFLFIFVYCSYGV